jgi:hypothetical protein
MTAPTNPPRYLVVLGDSAESLSDDSEVTILERVDRVFLVVTDEESATQIRHRPDLVAHSFERELDARRVFGLFRH